MERGWIKLYRRLHDNDLWLEKPFSRGQAWVDLLLLANHKPGAIWKRGNLIKIKRGQVGYSQKGLADRWGWSRTKTQVFLDLLEKEQQIKQQISKLTTIITLLNFSMYNEKEQQNGQQKGIRKTTGEHQVDINKNEKNGKNEKKEDIVFESLWEQYRMKDGKKEALRHFNATVQTEEDVENITKALKNYNEHLDKNTWKKPKSGKTWFNNWIDWIDFKEPEAPTPPTLTGKDYTKGMEDFE